MPEKRDFRYCLLRPPRVRKLPKTVRREKALVHSGRQTRPGTGSLHPVAIEAAAEVTKPLEPSV